MDKRMEDEMETWDMQGLKGYIYIYICMSYWQYRENQGISSGGQGGPSSS